MTLLSSVFKNVCTHHSFDLSDLFLPCLNTNLCTWIMGFVFFLRPCAIVVPDIELISKITLVAEGFIYACLLARKFITLCTVCRELLSKQVRVSLGFWV